MISHNHHLYEELTAEENLRFAATMRGIRPDRSRIRKALADVGLETQAAWKVRTYSTGMKRRLVIGKMLLFDPELLFLDEPHNTLDQAAIALLNGYVASVRARGGSAIVATHNLSRAYDMADRFVLMREGAVSPPRREAPSVNGAVAGALHAACGERRGRAESGRAESRACRETNRRPTGESGAKRDGSGGSDAAYLGDDVEGRPGGAPRPRAHERHAVLRGAGAVHLQLRPGARSGEATRRGAGAAVAGLPVHRDARPGSKLPSRARERVLRGALAHPRGPGIALLRQAGGEHPLHGDGRDS